MSDFPDKDDLLRRLATGELTDINVARHEAAHIMLLEGKITNNDARRGLGLPAAPGVQIHIDGPPESSVVPVYFGTRPR